jgi:elongation factor Ts
MYTINNLKKLRQMTGISFTLCKKALEEANNNLEKAKKNLEKWGIKLSLEKSKRITNQGSLFSYIHHNRQVAALLELLCETDFVAKNSDFQKIGQELVMQIASMNPKDIKEFLSQIYIKDSNKTVDNLIKEYILKIGENIKIGRFMRYEI